MESKEDLKWYQDYRRQVLKIEKPYKPYFKQKYDNKRNNQTNSRSRNDHIVYDVLRSSNHKNY